MKDMTFVENLNREEAKRKQWSLYDPLPGLTHTSL